MIFRCYYLKRGFNLYHFGRCILFMYFFKLPPFGFLKSCFFIKCYIPTNIYMMESWNVYLEGFGDFTVSNKYSFLSRRIQLGSLLFRNMYIYWTTKYLEMAYFRFLPVYISSGVLNPRALWDNLFCTYTVVLAASAHRCIGRSWSWIMFFTASMILVFFPSITPVWWGL